jgi:CxxC motif-containing protein (DUF1111 family)
MAETHALHDLFQNRNSEIEPMNDSSKSVPIRLLIFLVLIGGIVGCEMPDEAVFAEAGTELPDLGQTELGRFQAGLALFEKVYSPEEGLGPLFNENQCSACHTVPATGGTTGFEFVTKATRFENGVCDPLTEEGGENIRTNATPALKALGIEKEEIPPSATEVGRFSTPFLFGLGLVEAIADETILEREDPDDSDGNGISGRPGRTPDGRLARFGRKAELATILEFVDTALRFEMGLTTPLRTEEETINGTPVPPGTDPAPDPEISQDALELLTDFVRFLAPPAPAPPRSDAHRDTLEAGEQLFEDIGCAECHTPSMRTGSNEIPALDHKTVKLYSDLLLHDLGPETTDVCGYTARPEEVRTEMLMGLGQRQFFLHNGRAQQLEDAILLHGGEAQRARDAFAELTFLRQLFLLEFLRSL